MSGSSLIHELLAEDGHLFLHIGPNVSHYAKSILDEIFGADAFVNEIVWQRTLSKSLMSVRLRATTTCCSFTERPRRRPGTRTRFPAL